LFVPKNGAIEQAARFEEGRVSDIPQLNPKKFVATIEFRVQYFPTEICPCAFAGHKDTEDFRQRITVVSIGGVMILRQLCAAIAPILLIGAIAAPQPSDLSRLDSI
jgi:hypothetical protein